MFCVVTGGVVCAAPSPCCAGGAPRPGATRAPRGDRGAAHVARARGPPAAAPAPPGGHRHPEDVQGIPRSRTVRVQKWRKA